jgi:protein-S-isoprenylcysteine O-methyltransferase Ste14
MKYLLGTYALAYVLIVFLGRSYLVWRRTGVRPVTYRKGDTAHDLIGKYFLGLVFLSLISLSVYLFLPGLYPFLLPVPSLEDSLLTYFGLGLLWASFLWTVVAQSQMGESWRIGIDQEAHPPLVTEGLFRISRNPIYLGVRGSSLGLFFALPNGLNIVILTLTVVLTAIQVRLEEEHLKEAYGTEYLEYCERTARWIF